jgi:hypothetical protein
VKLFLIVEPNDPVAGGFSCCNLFKPLWVTVNKLAIKYKFSFFECYMSANISERTTPSANSTTVSMGYDLHSKVFILFFIFQG